MQTPKSSLMAALVAASGNRRWGKVSAVLLVAALIGAAVLGGGACGSAQEDPTPMSSPDLSAPEIISSSAQAMESVDSFRLVLSHDGGGTPAALGLEVTEITCDVIRPDRLKGTIEAMLLGSFVRLQLVTVGTTSYMTNPFNEEWEQVSTKFDASGLFDPDSSFAAMLGGMTNATRVNDEKVDGVDSYHIEGKIASKDLYPIVLLLRLTPAEGVDDDMEIWVGMDDLLLRRVRIKGQITADEKPGIVRTMSLSKFGQEVEIELPD